MLSHRSWFNQVTQSPPLVSVSILPLPNGGQKDTADNIKKMKEFTVSIISEPFVENANITSLDSPREVSEWGISGLTKAPSVSIQNRFSHNRLLHADNRRWVDPRQGTASQRECV